MISEPNLVINKVVRMAQAFINERLKSIGLSSGLFYFILELSENDMVSMQDLSRAVLVDNGHTTRAVARLVELGYVSREVDPEDSRSYLVSLTAKGRDSSAVIRNVLVEWANFIAVGVSKDDIATVYRVFDKYYSNARNMFPSRQ
jgi:DNA-binding MarR family transcriptional regulator